MTSSPAAGINPPAQAGTVARGNMNETRNRRMLRSLVLPALLVALALPLLCPGTADAQPAYDYGAFYTELNINADGSLLVRNKVTYEFQDSSGWVGLFVPASYGTLAEARVLAGDGTVLPDGSWDYEEASDGYTLWCKVSDAGPAATFTYEYLLYDAFEVIGDRIGIPEWGAVPAERGSRIDDSSVTLRFPADVDTSLVDLEVSTFEYDGQVNKRFVGSNTAVVEAAYLSAASSYSISCYWPSDIMDLAGIGFTAATQKNWDFERFDTDFIVHEDSSFSVRETQVVNFQGAFTFLNRDISSQPPDFDEGRTYGKVRVRDIAVYDMDGEPYNPDLWNVESFDWGKRVRIEFEAQDEQRGWIIEYRVTGGVIFSEDYDRLYWEIFTYDRSVPIKSSTATVSLPPGTDMATVRTTQYVNINKPPRSYDEGREGDTLWWNVQDIPPYSDFSIDVAFPKGAVNKPWQYDRPCGIAVIAASCALLAFILVYMLALWWKRGRDVGRTGTAMVRYEPPAGLTPAMVGMLVNHKPRVQDISATIVDLAIRGYLRIFEVEQRSIIRIKKYGFERLQEDISDLRDYEREIMKGLFESGDTVTQDDLSNKFYAHNDAIMNRGIKKEVLDRKLFKNDPSKIRSRYTTMGILVAATSLAAFFLLPIWFDLGWFIVLILSLIPAGLIIAAVGWAMPARSREGSRAYEHVIGFKEYMQTAEKPELEFMTPETFQANLPYAMVLGVEEAWARKFQDIYTTPPQWYSGTATTFNVVFLATSLNDMSGNLSRTLTSAPASSGSGGGGGFGGGSSGGGGGGGGSSAG